MAANKTPNYIYITPNLDEDAHDGTLAAADTWLSQHLPSILARPEFSPGGDGLLFVVWDEGNLMGDNRCSSTVLSGCGGRIATLVIGPQVKPQYKSQGPLLTQESAAHLMRRRDIRCRRRAPIPGEIQPGGHQSGMNLGSRYIVVQSWDKAGAIHQTGMHVTVKAQAVTVSSPLSNATVASPVSVVATAGGSAPSKPCRSTSTAPGPTGATGMQSIPPNN